MKDPVPYSRKASSPNGENEAIQKNMVLIKIGEMLLHQGMLTLDEKKDFDRMAQEQM